MERSQFLGADGQSWWLYEVEIDIRIDEARRELGFALGWTEREWFVDPYRREALFDFLRTKGPQLLVDLDTLSAYDEDRLRWMGKVKDLAAPPQQEADKDQPSGEARSSQAPVPEDRKATPGAGPAKKSAFKPKAGSGADTATGADPGPSPVGAAPATAHVEEATKAVLSDVGGPGLADLARELGVEPAELEVVVNDPDFERKVRDEVSRLVSA